MGTLISVGVYVVCAGLVLFMVAVLVVDMAGRVDYLRSSLPWLVKWTERKESHGILLLVCVGLLIGDGYELFTKEVPQIPPPPNVTFSFPAAPRLTINQLTPPQKKQCLVFSYVYMANPLAGLTTFYCNATYDSPFLLTLQYDQKLTKAEPAMLPMKGGIADYEETVRDNQVTMYFNYPSIKPNWPLSIVVYGDGQKTPAIKSVALRTKKGMSPEFIF